MRLENRLPQRHPPPPRLFRQRFLHSPQPPLQRLPHQPPQRRHSQPLRQRIHRHHPPGMHPRLLRPRQIRRRRIKLRLPPENLRLAAHHHPAPRLNRPRHILLPEPHRPDRPSIIPQHRLRILTPPLGPLRHHPRLPNIRHHRTIPPRPNLRHLNHRRKIIMPPRKQMQQIPHRSHIQTTQPLRHLSVNAPQPLHRIINPATPRRRPINRPRQRQPPPNPIPRTRTCNTALSYRR